MSVATKKEKNAFESLGTLVDRKSKCPRCKREHPVEVGYFKGIHRQVVRWEYVTCKNGRTYVINL